MKTCLALATALLAASPAWSQVMTSTPVATATGAQDGANFGASVAGFGDVNGDGFCDVLVGAPWHDQGNPDEGAVFLYFGGELGFAPTPAWSAFGGQRDARFGSAIAAVGDINGDGKPDLVVGAPFYDAGVNVDAGAVFVFFGRGASPSMPAGLPAQADIVKEGPLPGAQFGAAVAAAGRVDGVRPHVVVGAPLLDRGTPARAGGAFLFVTEISNGRPVLVATASLYGDQAGMQFGAAVAGVGHTKSLGYDDVMIGAPEGGGGDETNRGGSAGAGQVTLYYGGDAGIVAGNKWTSPPIASAKALGACIAALGDIDGNGFDDVAVGAPKSFATAVGTHGGVYVWKALDTGGLPPAPAWQVAGLDDGERFGTSIAAGDIDGDQRRDLIVGSLLLAAGQPGAGRVFVFRAGGAPGSFGPVPDWSLQDSEPASQFGWAVASTGDVNGDLGGDIVVGAPAGRGSARVYGGSDPHPDIPRGIDQWNHDGTETVPFQETVDRATLRIRARIRQSDGSGIRLQVQLKPVGRLFDGNDIVTGDTLAQPGTATVALRLLPGTDYKWRVRAENNQRLASNWIHFGPAGNQEDQVDVSTVAVPAPVASGLRQVRASDGREIRPGGSIDDLDDVRFEATAPGASRLDVEVQPIGESFQDEPTAEFTGREGDVLTARQHLGPNRYAWTCTVENEEWGLRSTTVAFGAAGETAFVVGAGGSVNLHHACTGSATPHAAWATLAVVFLLRRR